MFFDSGEFKVMEAGARLSWMQQQLNAQNIANLETAGYKSKNLTFKGVLSAARSACGDPAVGSIKASVIANDAASTRPDGNNVDLEAESVSLYKAYVQYSMLLQQINSEFDKYNCVLNCNM